MKRFKLLSAAVLLASSTLSFAQKSADVVAWKGVRFSYDHTFLNEDRKNGDDWGMNGFTIGYEHAFQVAKSLPIFIQTGLNLSFTRYSEDEEDESGYKYDSEEDNEYSYDDKTTLLGLSIPVNFVYGVKINDMLALKPYTGFYLRANIMGKEKYEDEEGSGTWNLFDKGDMEGKKNTWNRVQFGWQIGATLDINKFNIGIGYALDFNEIAEKRKCSIFSARLGYNF